MRKNRLFILGIFTVMVALVSLSLVSGTWAKYTSTVSGEDSATVAKWDVKYNSTSGAASETTIEFNLFSTIKDSNGTDNETDVETDLIAPGTSGSFSFKLSNDSDVNATYSITYTVTSTGLSVPLVFTGMDNVSNEDIAMGENKTIEINWSWPFAGDDTAIGIQAPTVTVKAVITFTQVD